jgi:hypothetical protein
LGPYDVSIEIGGKEMFSDRSPVLPLLFVATFINASILAACIPERGTEEVNLFTGEAPTSTESNQDLSDCINDFPEYIIDEKVDIGDMTFFMVNDAQRNIPLPDVCQLPSNPEVSDNAERMIYMEISHLEDILIFPFDLPTWAPDGYELQKNTLIWKRALDRYVTAVENGEPPPGFMFSASWQHPSGDGISTSVTFRGGPVWEWILTGSLKEVKVNSRPAALIRGQWEFTEDSLNWRDDRLFLIYDVGGNVRYGLSTKGDSVTAEELIQMAESIEPIP